MLFRNLFKTKWQAALIAVLIVVLLNVSIKSLFLNSNKELVYDFNTPRAICTKDETSCYFSGEFKLANTGVETLENVTIDFGEMPEGLNGSLKVFDLNASYPREFDPTVSNINFINGSIIEVSNFAPGTYIELNHSGLISARQKDLLVNYNPKVSAQATILQGDPQGTELARVLGALF